MKTKLLITLYWLIFVIPPLGYLVVNFYWWLFGGNVLNGDRMFQSILVLIVAGTVGIILNIEINYRELWDD